MFIQTPLLRHNGTLSKGNVPNKIILHHPVFDGTPQALNEMEIFNSADPMIMSGYNFYVRKDGSTYAMRPVWAIGANCYGQNSQSISVCAEGNFMVDTMGVVQQNAIVILCKYLKQAYPDITVVGPHKQFYNTDCPGKNYPVTAILNAIGSKTGSLITSSAPIAPVTGNAWVRALQLELNIQCNSKLSVDGIAGPKTLAACITVKSGSKGNITKLIQEKLGVTADGVFGINTCNAVMIFQLNHGLTEDGTVGPKTWAALLK